MCAADADADLWHALRRGQVEALGILYDRHVGLVYAIALKTLNNVAEAEDVTQDIFVRLVHTSYDPQRGSLRTYLAILARSRSLDRLRALQRSRNALAKLQASQPTDPVDNSAEEATAALHRAEQGQQIAAALQTLSDNQRQVLHLAYQEGLTQMAIAERLGLPLGTVKAWARRGLIKLRQTLQPLGEED